MKTKTDIHKRIYDFLEKRTDLMEKCIKQIADNKVKSICSINKTEYTESEVKEYIKNNYDVLYKQASVVLVDIVVQIIPESAWATLSKRFGLIFLLMLPALGSLLAFIVNECISQDRNWDLLGPAIPSFHFLFVFFIASIFQNLKSNKN